MPDLKIGFEFEFGVNRTRQALSHQFVNYTRHELGAYVQGGSYEKWSIHDDYSVYPGELCEFTAELVSPIMKYQTGILELEETLEFLKEVGAMTCPSSGLHVGLSFVDLELNKKVQPLNLLFSIPEIELLKKFHRNRNRYSKSLAELLKSHRGRWCDGGTMISKRADDTLKSWYSHGSYSMEFGKLLYPTIPDQKRYIEFRITGGPEYPNRFKEIQETIEIYREAMLFSLEPNDDFVKEKLYELAELIPA